MQSSLGCGIETICPHEQLVAMREWRQHLLALTRALLSLGGYFNTTLTPFAYGAHLLYTAATPCKPPALPFTLLHVAPISKPALTVGVASGIGYFSGKTPSVPALAW